MRIFPFPQNSILEKENSLSPESKTLREFWYAKREFSFSKMEFWGSEIFFSHFLTKKYLAEISCITLEFIANRWWHNRISSMIFQNYSINVHYNESLKVQPSLLYVFLPSIYTSCHYLKIQHIFLTEFQFHLVF